MPFETRATKDYEKMTVEETFEGLETSANGLAAAEAAQRLKTCGYNEIAEKKKNPVLEFLSRYWGPMPWLLELAIGLSFILGHRFEGAIIFLLLTVNAVIGFVHSRGSQKAVQLLKKKLAVRAKALRDSAWAVVDAREIVPGDILSVRVGDIIPADAKLIGGELSVDRSALTGESLPVGAKELDIVYSGSIVRRGEARCAAVNTGSRTYFGRTAELVKIAKPVSHQQEVMMSIVRYAMYFGIAATAFVSAYALILRISPVMILTFAVIFLMGAVPVALPAVLTIVQAVGAMELSGKGVLVTRLDSIEDAASIDVLCLDKTGTITQNRLSVAGTVPLNGFKEEDVIATARLASREEDADPIDAAIIEHAGGRASGGIDGLKQVSFTPFSPSTRRTEAALESSDGRRLRAVKGAAPTVMSICAALDEETRKEAERAVETFAVKGHRVLAVARGEAGNELTLAGLVALSDPLRPDSRDMIGKAVEFGIKPLLLTGDNIAIAREIASQAGIKGRIIKLRDLDGMSDAQKVKMIEESGGLAEIYPEDKYAVVKLLQSKGRVVGMTGDGVNDAPALKQAEMGIAVSNSTDVAKASASVVLTEPGVAEIIDAVRISRETYQRMLSWVINKVTKVIEFIILLTIGFVYLHKVALSLLGMSLLVFANDFMTMSLATDNVKHTANPNKWNVRNIALASLPAGMLLAVAELFTIFVGIRYFRLGFDRLRALVLLNMVFNSQFRVLIVRERNHFWSSRPGTTLLALSALTVVGFAALGVSGLLFPPLRLDYVLAVLAFSMACLAAMDFPKTVIFRKFGL